MSDQDFINAIIKEEIDSILVDLLKAYEDSGKKTTGEFAKGLTAVYDTSKNSGTIVGYTYLAGRRAGQMPPVAALLKWVVAKGIAAKGSGKASGIAWAIAKKIAREGTNTSNNMKIYEQIITPQRIQSIIDKVSSISVNRIILGITTEIEILAKNV